MILVQSILLKVALDNRPPSGTRHGLEHAPFSAYSREGIIQQLLSGKRPYQFWQWPTSRPYAPDILLDFRRRQHADH
jgi:solute carrier family 66, member 2